MVAVPEGREHWLCDDGRLLAKSTGESKSGRLRVVRYFEGPNVSRSGQPASRPRHQGEDKDHEEAGEDGKQKTSREQAQTESDRATTGLGAEPTAFEWGGIPHTSKPLRRVGQSSTCY